MSERRPLSKKLRFEVFKRDSFACQYCGRRAPEVILQCDHLKPVAAGGETDILNLVTSCFECNAGKGARLLSDQAALTKQLDQLADLNERREQLEMMIQWRDELARLDATTLDAIIERMVERAGWEPNQAGTADIRRWLKRYTAGEILAAANEAFDAYLEFVKDSPTAESWNKAFLKIPAFLAIARAEREKPYIRRLLYIQGIIRRRLRNKRFDCIDYLEHVHLCGLSIDDMEARAKKMRSREDFEGPIDEWLQIIGKSF